MLFALRYILNASQNNHSKSIQADKLQCAIENGKRLTIHKNSKRGRETDRDRDRDIKNILPAVSKNSIVFGSVCLQMQIMNVHAKRACPFQMHTHTHIRWTICWTQQKNIQNRCYFVTRHWHRYQHQNMDFVVATTMVLMFSCWFNFFFVYLDFIIIWELASLCWFFLISCELHLNFVYEQSRRCFWMIASFAIPNRTTHIFFVEQMRFLQTSKYLTNQLMHGDKSKAIVSTISYAMTNATACITE